MVKGREGDGRERKVTREREGGREGGSRGSVREGE